MCINKNILFQIELCENRLRNINRMSEEQILEKHNKMSPIQRVFYDDIPREKLIQMLMIQNETLTYIAIQHSNDIIE